MAAKLLTRKTATLGLSAAMQMSAHFDRTKRYRFSLHRRWHESGDLATFVMLNPSTADHQKNDPTIARCIQLARFWGFSGINVVNLFAFRTSSPARLRQILRPVGKENDFHIRLNAEQATRVILGWGNHGDWLARDKEVLSLLSGFDLWSIGKTKSGQPRHPLYAPGNIQLQRFEPESELEFELSTEL